MLKRWLLAGVIAAFFLLCGNLSAQGTEDDLVIIHYRNIEFRYNPEAFGAVLASYDVGTPYQTDAPYFANTAPHTTFKFMRPDPTRPDTNWVGELRVYRIADLETYGEPSYRDVVAQLRNLDTNHLNDYITLSTGSALPTLPFMPVLNALQVFRVHPQAFDTEAVRGIEYYTYYSQAPEPILEGQVFYVYQGLTVDGKYYLSFSMPIITGSLDTTIPADMNWDAFTTQYPAYLQDVFVALNAVDPASYTPSAVVLSNFIHSISIRE